MSLNGTPANVSNLAKGSLAAKIFAAQTTGITVTADAYTTASGTKYGQFPTGNSILKLTSTTQSNVTKVEFMGVESASQTDSAVTLGTCIRDLDWEDGTDFTSQSDGLAFPAGTTVELVWTVQHAENTPFKNNANTFTGKQTFSGGVALGGTTAGLELTPLTTAEREALTPANGTIVYDETLGVNYQYIGGAWAAVEADTTANGSETVAGRYELGTSAQVDAETDTGETGAFLVARPSHIVSQNNLASTATGKGSALVGHEGGTTVKAKLDALDAKGGAQVDVFTSSGTWTKPANAKMVRVLLIGGGGGGGSGRRNSGAPVGGGGGGGPGSLCDISLDASSFGATETVTIGAGGPGGAEQSTNADGNIGTAGSNTTMATAIGTLYALGGNAGVGGTGTSAAGGAAKTASINSISVNGASAGGAGAVGTATAGGAEAVLRPTGGGGGGGRDVVTTGGAAGGAIAGSASHSGWTGALIAGGAAGSANGAGGNGNTAQFAGTGGGGGGGNASGAGGAGGNGGSYGAGGGGGGGAIGGNSGKGGDGAQGVAVIVSYF
jgi:hypothetical protein